LSMSGQLTKEVRLKSAFKYNKLTEAFIVAEISLHILGDQ